MALVLPVPPQLGPPEGYVFCVWLAATDDEPFEWYDELDAERWSIRCVRKYRDGRFEAYSYASDNWRDTMPDAPMPLLETINRDPEFAAKDISPAEFEAVWSLAMRGSG